MTSKTDAYLMELGVLELERNLNDNFDNTNYGRELQAKLDRLWYVLSDEERALVNALLAQSAQPRADDSVTLNDLIIEDDQE